MTRAPRRAGLRRDHGGAVTLEFALTATAFLMLILGLMDTGLILWTKSVLQLTASVTARCYALGACQDPASFAVTEAKSLGMPGTLPSGDVTVATASTCYAAAGSATPFVKVTISMPVPGLTVFPAAFQNATVNVSACFPQQS